jgi:hypothetical protein
MYETGAVSIAIPGWAIGLVLACLAVVLAFGAWKLFKFFWALGG